MTIAAHRALYLLERLNFWLRGARFRCLGALTWLLLVGLRYFDGIVRIVAQHIDYYLVNQLFKLVDKCLGTIVATLYAAQFVFP